MPLGGYACSVPRAATGNRYRGAGPLIRPGATEGVDIIMAEQTCRIGGRFPDDEQYNASCVLPAGHPDTVHKDPVIGEWDEGEIYGGPSPA